jgi:hypothetical protein
MEIHLSDETKAWAESQAAGAGYSNLDAYFEALVRRDQDQTGNWLEEMVNTECPSEPANEKRRADVRQSLHERVVALLDEAVASGPAVEMTSQDWEGIRRQVRERRSIPEK